MPGTFEKQINKLATVLANLTLVIASHETDSL